MLNVGLVGFGVAGKVFHAPVIRAVEGLRLTVIVQRHGAPDPGYSDVEFVRSVDELLARAVDLVVVATPNASHHPIARQCLLAGRHVVIDKPFTTTVAEAEELVQLGREKRRVLSAYQNRRYVGDFVTLRRLLSEGALGRVAIFESHFDRFRPQLKPAAWREQPQPGSGIWFDLGAHLLDQALVLFGIPQAISADIRCEREGAVADDAFDVTLHYPHMRALLRACKRWIDSGDPVARRVTLLFVGTGARPTDPGSGLVMPIARECGADGFVEMEAWGRAREAWLRERLELARPAPGVPFDHGTFAIVEEPFDAPWPADGLRFTEAQIQWGEKTPATR